MPYDVDGQRGRTPMWLGGVRGRKVKPDEVGFMRELRDLGWSYRRIGNTAGRGSATVQYHLKPKERQNVIKRMRNWRREHLDHARNTLALRRIGNSGVCQNCQLPVAPNKSRCERHRKYHADRQRARYWRLKGGTGNRQTQAA